MLGAASASGSLDPEPDNERHAACTAFLLHAVIQERVLYNVGIAEEPRRWVVRCRRALLWRVGCATRI